MIRLILVRHAETDWARQKRYQGKTDIPLNARGLRQAACLRRRFRSEKFGIIYSSPLKRAQKTVSVMLGSKNRNTLTDDRLMEISFGAWEGRNAEELLRSRNQSYLDWVRNGIFKPSGGEPLKKFRTRLQAFLKDVRRRHKDQNVLIMTHGGAVRTILMLVMKLGEHAMWSFRVEPASVSVLELDRDVCRMSLWNDTSHMRGFK